MMEEKARREDGRQLGLAIHSDPNGEEMAGNDSNLIHVLSSRSTKITTMSIVIVHDDCPNTGDKDFVVALARSRW